MSDGLYRNVEARARANDPPALDPERIEDAKLRAEGMLRDALYHELQAAVARKRADLLGRTWGFDASSLLDDRLRAVKLPASSLDSPRRGRVEYRRTR